mgnify:CR=1 FL=1
MNLELKNIGLIESAKLNLNGVSLIAAENNTGKSTIGKSLFALIFSTNNFKTRFLEDLKKRFSETYSMYEILASGDKEGNNFRNIRKRFFDTLYNQLSNENIIIEDFENIFLEMENIIKKIEKKDRDRVLNFKSFFKNEKSLSIERLREVLDYKKIIKSVFEESFNEEFESGISNLFLEKKESFITFKDDNNGLIKVNFKNDKVNDFEFESEIIRKYNVIYIESPVLLDYIENIIYNKNMNFLDIEIQSNNKVNPKLSTLYDFITSKRKLDTIDNILGERSSYERILENIKKEISGDMEYDKKLKKLLYKKNGKEFDIKNIATGIKSFGILELLLKNERLDEKTILIIDEPEVHLHPKWQIRYAELLILISKSLKVKVLLNSHSPYFIRALSIYGRKYKYQDYMDFYISTKTSNISTKVIKAKSDLTDIFDVLMEPYEVLEIILDESDGNE